MTKQVAILFASLAIAVIGCGRPPPPASLGTAESVAHSSAVADAATVAPQLIAHARDLHRQASDAYDRGSIAVAGILAERSIVAYERAAVLARLARAELLAAEAENNSSEFAAQQRELDAERKRLEADIATIEQLILVVKDARPTTPTRSGDASLEAARIAAARSVVVDARLLCSAARLLGRGLDGLEAAESEVTRLEEALAQWPQPAPIDDALRSRTNCLSFLTLAHRSGPSAPPADLVLTELSQSPGMQPIVDDRGVVVVVQGNVKRDEEARARVDAFAKVAEKHPQCPVLVVRHTRARASKAAQDMMREYAQSIADTLEAAGVNKSRLEQIDAGPHRPLVSEPVPPPPNSKNDRVELVLVTPLL